MVKAGIDEVGDQRSKKQFVFTMPLQKYAFDGVYIPVVVNHINSLITNREKEKGGFQLAGS